MYRGPSFIDRVEYVQEGRQSDARRELHEAEDALSALFTAFQEAERAFAIAEHLDEANWSTQHRKMQLQVDDALKLIEAAQEWLANHQIEPETVLEAVA